MGHKRGNGEGSVFRRKDGTWVAAVTAWHNGVRKRVTRTASSQRDANAKRLALLRDIEQGINIGAERQTVGEYLDAWLKDVVVVRRRPKTAYNYTSLIRTHITPALGRVQLDKLTAQQIARFLEAKARDGYAPRTLRLLHTILRSALKQAVKWELVPKNVAMLVDAPPIERYTPAIWSPDDARRFLTAMRGQPCEALYLLALATGMRQGELLGLRWQDLDLDAGVLTVRHTLEVTAGPWKLAEPKTRSGRRTIALPPMVCAALRVHRVQQLETRLAHADGWQEHDLVFPATYGQAMHPSSIREQFRRLLGELGLPVIRFHDLRHSCASLLFLQGVHPKVVQEQLGHSSMHITMDTYSHVLPPIMRETAGLMERLLAANE